MADGIEVPRVLTVDTDSTWRRALRIRLEAMQVGFEQAKEAGEALEKLNSGDFTAVIMDGLKGQWRTIVDEADRLDVKPVVLSRSTTAVHQAEVQGVTAYHKNRSLNKSGIDPIIRSALRPQP